MNSIGNNIKEYPEFDMNTDSQKIGIFVVKNRGEYQSPTYIRLLSVFNNLNLNVSPCIIDVKNEDVVKLVESDLLNDNFLLDMVILSRDAFYSNEFVELLTKKCKLLGIKIIYELDDDLMNIDKSHRDYNYYVKKRPGIFFIAKNADIITVSTNTLKSKLHTYNENIIVIPNVITHYWDVKVPKKQQRDKHVIKIGYMGTPTHRDDIRLIEKAIQLVKNYFKEKDIEILFEMIGGTAEKLSWANQIEIPDEDKVFPNFVKFLKKNVDWDVAVAPLEDNNINSSKSELKYIEYSCLGIPGIYSAIGPYKENIIHEFNGLLIKSNSPEEWAENIIKLVENDKLRDNIINNSKKDMEENYNLDISINAWSKIIKSNLRDKNNILYKKFKWYTENCMECSFYDYLIQESYNIIKESKLFDEEYYLSEYPEVKNLDMDPIAHYLNLGDIEGCEPNSWFDNLNYMNFYSNINTFKINPFVHYILYGNIFRKPFVRFKDTIFSSDYNDNFNVLSKSSYFDENYYLNKYPDVARSNMQALEHWIKYGFRSKEYYRNPNNYFSKLYYISKYLSKGEGYWNSLTHYEKIGRKRGYKQNMFDVIFKDYDNIQIDNINNALSKKISIIIPIFNDFSELHNYLKDLVNNTNLNYEIVFLINKRLTNNLESVIETLGIEFDCVYFEDHDFYNILQYIINNLNNDFVLLNSYTKVTNNWLKKLIIKAYSNSDVAAVSPISNYTGGLSLNEINKLSNSHIFSIEELSLLIQKSADNNNILMGYWDGSCIFVKKDVIEEINFNDISFTYDENENILFGLDLSFKNKIHILDDSTYVYLNEKFFEEDNIINHKESCSMSSLKIKEFLCSFEVRDIKKNIKSAVEDILIDTLSKRIVYIFDESNFKLIKYYLMQVNIKNQDCFFLTFDSKHLKLWKNDFLLESWNIPSNIRYDNQRLKNIYFNIFSSLNADEVHVLDFTQIIFSLVDILSMLDIKLIITCDDYGPFCPFVSTRKYCNNECDYKFDCPHDFVKEYKEYWNENFIKILDYSNSIIINDSLSEIFNQVFHFSNQQKIKYNCETFWKN